MRFPKVFLLRTQVVKKLPLILKVFHIENLEMHLTTDIQELLFMLKSIQQNICSKLADCSYKNYENSTEILVSLIPLGFSQSRVIVHNIAVILNKVFSTERLNIFEDRSNALIFNLTITLINYWIADLVSNDNFLLSATVDLLESLSKSGNLLIKIHSW
jgi:hypothetical protein